MGKFLIKTTVKGTVVDLKWLEAKNEEDAIKVHTENFEKTREKLTDYQLLSSIVKEEDEEKELSDFDMKICPCCDEIFDLSEASLSREDNETEICSECGTREALSIFINL